MIRWGYHYPIQLFRVHVVLKAYAIFVDSLDSTKGELCGGCRQLHSKELATNPPEFRLRSHEFDPHGHQLAPLDHTNASTEPRSHGFYAALPAVEGSKVSPWLHPRRQRSNLNHCSPLRMDPAQSKENRDSSKRVAV